MKRSVSSGRSNMRHGLISLLTMVVLLSLATAAVLAVSTSHAMAALAGRQATMTAEGYAAEGSAQAFLAELDALVHETHTASRAQAELDERANRMLAEACEDDVSATYALEDNTITCTYTTQNGRQLETVIELGDATYTIEAWRLSAAPQEEDTGETLWTGTTTEN